MTMDIFDAAASDPRIAKILQNPSISGPEAATRITALGHYTTASSVKRYRQRMARGAVLNNEDPYPASHGASERVNTGRADVDPDGVTIEDFVTDQEIHDDWTFILKKFNLNPDNFEVVDETVRMSTWMQSKRLENGDRDTIQLYSYSARFRRITREIVAPETFAKWRSVLLNLDPPSKRPWRASSASRPVTYNILIADPQLGKKATEVAVGNWKTGLVSHAQEINLLLDRGVPIEAIHLAFQGDEHEGVYGNYQNQQHTIELNRTQQLELDFDLSVWSLKELANFDLPISVSSVISNHGEWTRREEHEPETSANDNSSTHVRRIVKKLFDELEPHGGPEISWTIGSDRPGVIVPLSGVKCYFSHGYVEKGKGATSEIKVKNAIEEQILGRPMDLGDIPLWFMAHYHHYYQWEDRGRATFGCPALEAERSSEYMLDQYGVWSPAGMLGLLVGNHTTRKWSNLNIF